LELTPTTELEAVNVMLDTIGESPVSDLDTVTSIDVSKARDMLRAFSREIQSKGWWFNSDEQYEFTLDAQGYCVIPNQILSLRPSIGGLRLTLRNKRVWDLDNKTDKFDTAPACDVVWFFDYEELPETARRYIAIRAGRVFQTSVLGSETQDVFTRDHESEAYTAFASEHDDFQFARGLSFISSTESSDIWDH